MGLTEKEKFNLIKPLPEGRPKDNRGVPYLKKETSLNLVNWNKVNFASFTNIKSTNNKKNKILLNFHYDKVIISIYNNIFNFARKCIDFLAVTTPDYSAYSNMESWKIEENVIHNLWVGAWLQYLQVKIIPAITRADERTYDICFNHIEKESIVAISTIGVSKSRENFLKGFNEMKKRINPSLIIVRGKYIHGMTGKFIFVDFDETFEKKTIYKKISLFEIDRIQVIKKEIN